MTNYVKPREVPELPQGAYTFTPIIKTFGPFDDLNDLQTDINSYFLLELQSVDSSMSISSINYQATQKSNNKVVHSALLHYTLITVN